MRWSLIRITQANDRRLNVGRSLKFQLMLPPVIPLAAANADWRLSLIAKVVDRSVFLSTPASNIAVLGATNYIHSDGDELLSMHKHMSRSDTADVGYKRWSTDGGKTWSEPVVWPCAFDAEGGQGRRQSRGGFVDPGTGRFVSVWTVGVLPTDNPLEGFKQWTLRYSVSDDGDRTQLVDEQIIHAPDENGNTYDAVHHLPGVTVGRNCAMIGDYTQRPMTRSDGVILMPIQVSPTGPDGYYHNPGRGYTYTDCQLLMGTWQDDGRLAWRASDRIAGDPEKTSRGLIEPTIAELPGDRLLMVMRGSNDSADMHGWRWIAISNDGGQTWDQPRPWTYTDGGSFHSPSSCSQLVLHPSGRLFWVGNLCEQNPLGNSPRYPIVIAEVDMKTGLLIRESVTSLDDRQPGESERLTLSNFLVRVERGSGDLLLHLSRLFADPKDTANGNVFHADAMLYRIELV